MRGVPRLNTYGKHAKNLGYPMNLPLTDTYSELNLRASQLVHYPQAVYVFTILLADGRIIHFEPCDVSAFDRWLLENRIPNVLDTQRFDSW